MFSSSGIFRSAWMPPQKAVWIPSVAASGAMSASGSISFAGSSTLTGSGALVGSGAITFAGTSTLAAAGALAGSGTITFAGISTATATGAMVGSGSILFSGTSTLTGAGALAGSGTIVFAGTSTLAGAGAMVATGAITFGGSGSMASGGMVASGTVTFGGSGTLAGSGALAGSGTITLSGSGTLRGSGALVASGSISFGGGVTLTPGMVASGSITFGGGATASIPISRVIGKPTVSNQFLLELYAGFRLRGFVQHDTNVWKVTVSDYTSATFNDPLEVKENGGTMTEVDSIAAVQAGGGTWFFSAGVFYVRPHFADSINNVVIVATIPFYLSSKPKIFSNQYYDPRLQSIPNLSLRIEPRFSGVGQIGSGACTIANADGYFDELSRVLDWDYGRAVFKMGIDTDVAMPYADYEILGTWGIDRVEAKEESFSLNLRELRTALELSIPFETYNQTDYPQLSQSDVGKVIPLAYGKNFGVKPVLLDPGTKRFKLASHAIFDILEVRIQNDNVWTVTNPATRDLTNAEFTLGDDWSDQQPVSVDFIGKTLANGRPMYNASSVVEDLLTYLGETNLDSDSFTAAYNSLDIGLQNDGIRRTALKPSLYIDSSSKALDIIGEINQIAGSFLYVNAQAEWHYEVFEPKALDAVDFEFSQVDLIDQRMTEETDAQDIFSKAIVRYARRTQDGFFQSVEQTRTTNRYAHLPTAETIKEFDAPIFEESDAQLYAQRILSTEGLPLRSYRFDVPWQAFFVLPGKQIHVTYSPLGLDTILEAIEVKHDLINCRISITAGDRRGWADNFGFWVADSQPAWSAGDSDAVKLSNKQSSGYWHGDDSLAVSTDGKSGFVSEWW